ncbi:unnamed protein product [Fraxinus pennsylvanica]|uniref:Aconitase/3-isopropylmalate dehydratase large subunit alpha/beta/alpha domain-containing protein n=1 Tax=Fraxinus pennsylvanica TaxID=56036 RepID=A0AAD1ZM58_9LAMI|nr:unnamed protein product [Fraxinus pennsylvanica]
MEEGQLNPRTVEVFGDFKGHRNGLIKALTTARVLLQDFTGVPAVVDLTSMRDVMKNLGSDPDKINPLVDIDLCLSYAVFSRFDIDFEKEPTGTGKDGKSVYFKDIWPSSAGIAE